MAGINIKIDDKEVQKALSELAKQTSDLSIPMAQISEYLWRSTRERFRTQQSPDGIPWKALSKKYQTKKKRNKDKVLTDRGYLQGRLVRQSDANSLEIGSNSIYAATHQFGRDKIPARPFLGLSEDDKNKVIQILQNHIKKSLS